MQIKTEKDMIDFCKEVNCSGGTFKVALTRNLSSQEIQSRLAGITLAEPPEKVNQYTRGDRLKELFIQGVNDISYDPNKSLVIVDETPRIYPSGRAPAFEGSMTGVLVNASCEEGYVFHMRGRSVAEPFGFQAAAAGFGNFGENPRETVKDELKTEAGIIKTKSLLEESLGVLPFMKGKYPQPLFLYGMTFDSSQTGLPILSSMQDVMDFEREVKEKINGGAKIQEAYPFIIPSAGVNSFVDKIYHRDPSQSGKNGGFFGPIKESHEIFARYK